MADDSEIVDGKDGSITFIGPDAVKYYATAQLWSFLGLWAEAKIVPTRGVTITMMLESATKVTGKRYPRGVKGALAAREDLKVWMDNAKLSLPRRDA